MHNRQRRKSEPIFQFDVEKHLRHRNNRIHAKMWLDGTIEHYRWGKLPLLSFLRLLSATSTLNRSFISNWLLCWNSCIQDLSDQSWVVERKPRNQMSHCAEVRRGRLGRMKAIRRVGTYKNIESILFFFVLWFRIRVVVVFLVKVDLGLPWLWYRDILQLHLAEWRVSWPGRPIRFFSPMGALLDLAYLCTEDGRVACNKEWIEIDLDVSNSGMAGRVLMTAMLK